MSSDTSVAFAGRIPNERAAILDQAVEEGFEYKSDLVVRALRYYMAENPDRLQAFQPENKEEDFLAKAGIIDSEI